PDIVVGTPVANRTRSEVEGLIGFFVNTLVLRTEVNGELTVRDLLHRVREVCLGAYAHQEVPFEMLVEQLQPERNMSYTPLFQVMLNLLNISTGSNAGINGSQVRDSQSGQLRVESFSPPAGLTAKYDLTLSAQEQNEQLFVVLTYSTELFDEATIKRMLGHFQNVLEALVSQPEQRLSELTLMSEAERHEVLVEWNETKQKFPCGSSLAMMFAQQVERTPWHIAVVYEDQQLTYRELNARANQLAHYLRSRGAGVEVLVGVCLERSVELMVALLGVLKAGAGYVPLDPGYPAERLQFMCEDAGIGILLSSAKLEGVLPEFSGERILLDRAPALSEQSES